MPFVSKTNSSTGLIKQNGEVIAICHKTQKKSYHGKPPAVATSTMKASFKDPGEKLALEKYHPNALRNRNAVHFDNAAKPMTRFCFPRNQHTHK
mmetsp:Transcript_38717/g.102116  ORF Transcript_38717/g.102116 Transcript_38717/m.102116 type:complete len:94 (+) Transcript_38717:73-354(+)